MKLHTYLLVLGLTTCSVISTLAPTFPVLAESEEKNYTIEEAYWDSNDLRAIAYWSEPDSKTSYKIRLYKGSKAVGSLTTVSRENYDFSSLIAKQGTGTYTFQVYPTRGDRTRDLIKSDSLSVDGEYLAAIKKSVNNANDIKNNSNQNSRGPGNTGSSTNSTIASSNMQIGWNKVGDVWYYKYSNGTLPSTKWEIIHDKWYYFNDNNIMHTGWLSIGGKWYLLHPTQGEMLTGWQNVNENWYYLDPTNGNLWVDTTTPDGYKVDANGVWIK